ncbi:ribosomal RNA large subunit methyltransferase, ftsJ-like protein [Candidatus Blochmanniella vafra str. BVAF]|uniref:Ribosomal RNA large subunit methyltransferase E n=1 Tax=Blochmanniella vafra (strain BVAF) TaxID=859654 RepID=E8Q6R5_BLOVB|nr:SAM-dependent methyltransferase [Candidatus Blochmannia vafer]ADV33506.1 ribosomal RNA large subunit methyltransferase, ftsJ-like protein [Candidatus Blochmannia vafer str. BVAF]
MLNKKCFTRTFKWSKKYYIDKYSNEAKVRKLRSRSWFKLQFIDQIDVLFKKGTTVIDLGSAPGGWSIYAANKINNTGYIMACDILPMKTIYGVDFVQGNCADLKVINKICCWAKDKKVQVILSDMSPKTTGISVIDVYNSIHLGNIALNICKYVLVFEGSFVVKIFQGKGFEQYLHNVKSLFFDVKIRKPSSSRCNSREVYIVAKKFKYKYDMINIL